MAQLKRILATLLLCSACASAQAAHGGDVPAIGHGTASSVTSGNWTISGTNLAMTIKIVLDSNSATVSSVSWSKGSGTAVEVKLERSSAGNATSDLWCLPAPVSGTGTITANFSASVGYNISASYWTGTDQTTPCPTGDVVFDQASASSDTLTPTNLTANDGSDGVVSDTVGNINSVSPNQSLVDNSGLVDIGTGYALGTASMSYASSDTSSHPFIVVRIKASGGGSAPVGFNKQRKLEQMEGVVR